MQILIVQVRARRHAIPSPTVVGSLSLTVGTAVLPLTVIFALDGALAPVVAVTWPPSTIKGSRTGGTTVDQAVPRATFTASA